MVTNCRNCDTAVRPVISLGEMPLVNSLLNEEDIAHEKKYDLTVGFCPACHLLQLMYTVPPSILFEHYLYFSSVSSTFLKHCEQTARSLTDRLGLSHNSLVLEIASNDGALLQYFQKLGIPVLGVDPAKNIAKRANALGIPTRAEFFSLPFAERLVSEDVRADLVYGANVLAHVPAIRDFLKGVQVVLKEHGTAIFEFPYVQGLLENKFDTIYHEHVFYYSLIALRSLFSNEGLEIYDVETLPVQGGSLRIFAGHRGAHTISSSVEALVQTEIRDDYMDIRTFERIGTSIEALKQHVLEALDTIKQRGGTIAAYSASAKGMILLNYFGIDERYLDFIVDKAPAKQGLYTPGTHLLIHPPQKIFTERPDYVLILCWNLKDEVMQELEEYRTAGGAFIVPIPSVHIL